MALFIFTNYVPAAAFVAVRVPAERDRLLPSRTTLSMLLYRPEINLKHLHVQDIS